MGMLNGFVWFLVCLCLSLSNHQAWAEEGLNGLLLNQTRTTFGRSFYDQFCIQWGEPKIDLNYTIVINEIPDARWGSLINIKVNGQEAYRRSLRPRKSMAEQEAKIAIQYVRQFVIHLIRENGSQGNPDLAVNGY